MAGNASNVRSSLCTNDTLTHLICYIKRNNRNLRERERDRQTDRQIDRDRDRQTDRQRERERERERFKGRPLEKCSACGVFGNLKGKKDSKIQTRYKTGSCD